MKRKYDVNDDFFKEINSEEKAYLLGFFLFHLILQKPLLHFSSQCQNGIHVLCDFKVAELGVHLSDVGGGLTDLVQLAFVAAVLFHQTQLILGFPQDGLAAHDGVTDALTGNTRVFGDLRKGEILVIIQVEKLFLLFGEQLAVIVVQHRHMEGIAFHTSLPFL